MKSVPKLIRRFVSIMLLSSALLILLNFGILAVIAFGQASNSHPWKTAEETAGHLRKSVDADGNEKGYSLAEDGAMELQRSNAWAILIDNATGKVVWQTDNLPETVPMSYSAWDIASLTRGYIDGYPTFIGEAEGGLLVLGYPKDSFWKHMWPSWDYNLIANLPQTVLCVFLINMGLIFAIYMTANSRLLKSVKPIVTGIQALSRNEEVHIREKGLLSELAASINKTSDILQSQNKQLRKRETARANWIAGVSHDIRTPLSMVMGYAGQLESDQRLPEEDRRKAAIMVKQSRRMRNLINDLNLASKLEYNMQPINPRPQNLIAVVRQVVVDFINMSADERYLMEWETDETLTSCLADVDKDLIGRAVSNLIQNSMNHNGQGCRIFVRVIAQVGDCGNAAAQVGDQASAAAQVGDCGNVVAQGGSCRIVVADDGVGATDEQIERLNNSPHYMVCDENTSEQRHGLGLLIVKQIAFAHGGKMQISHSRQGGFEVELSLPMIRAEFFCG